MIELNNAEHLTTSEAADLTGYNESYLQKLAASGKVQAFKIGNSWAINKQSLLRFGKKSEPKFRRKAQKKRPVHMRLKAMQLGHKLWNAPDGRVRCRECQETVTIIVKESLECQK